MALFAAFGGFATLIMASFGGTRRDKVIAHFGLAVIGSLGLIIGTAVSGITWLAVLVTIPVTFGIFFAGVAGPNAASGVTAAAAATAPLSGSARADTESRDERRKARYKADSPHIQTFYRVNRYPAK